MRSFGDRSADNLDNSYNRQHRRRRFRASKGSDRRNRFAFPSCFHLQGRRRMLELMQLFPHISIHEELTEVALLYLQLPKIFHSEDLSIMLADTLPVFQSPAQRMSSDPFDSWTRHRMKSAEFRHKIGRTTLSKVQSLHDTPTASFSKYFRDVKRTAYSAIGCARVREADEAGSEEASEVDENVDGLTAPEEFTADSAAKRQRSDDHDPQTECALSNLPKGLHGAIRAIEQAPSLRNTISVSMPRRLNIHSTHHRILVCPILDCVYGTNHCRPAFAEATGGLVEDEDELHCHRCVVHLSEVMDQSLQRELAEICTMFENPSLRDEKITAAIRRSESSISDLAQQRLSTVRPGSPILLRGRRMLPGCTVPFEPCYDSEGTLLNRDKICQAVNTVVTSLTGEASYVELQFASFSYQRQEMTDVVSSSSLDMKKLHRTQRVLGASTTGEPTTTNILDPEALKRFAAEYEAHLRDCGVVEEITEYFTTVVVVHIVDRHFSQLVACDSANEESPDESIFSAFKKPPEVCELPAVVVCGNITGSMPSVAPTVTAHNLFGVGEEVERIPIAAGSGPWFYVRFTPIDESSQKRKYSNDRSADIIKASFCCPREEFECALCIELLREAYLGGCLRILVTQLRCRLSNTALLAEYEKKRAEICSKRSALPSQSSTAEAIACEAREVHDLAALNRSARYKSLFSVANFAIDSDVFRLDLDSDGQVTANVGEDVPSTPSQATLAEAAAAVPMIPTVENVLNEMQKFSRYFCSPTKADGGGISIALLERLLMSCGLAFSEAAALREQLQSDCKALLWDDEHDGDNDVVGTSLLAKDVGEELEWDSNDSDVTIIEKPK